MSKKEKIEPTPTERNELIWAEVKMLEDEIESIKKGLLPAELPKQASLNDCNTLARKAKVQAVKVDPERLEEESKLLNKQAKKKQ